MAREAFHPVEKPALPQRGCMDPLPSLISSAMAPSTVWLPVPGRLPSMLLPPSTSPPSASVFLTPTPSLLATSATTLATSAAITAMVVVTEDAPSVMAEAEETTAASACPATVTEVIAALSAEATVLSPAPSVMVTEEFSTMLRYIAL